MTAHATGGGGPGATTVVIQTAFLGDVVLTTPLLQVLAERHGPVDVVATAGAAPLLDTHPAVRVVHRYDKRGADRGLAGLRRLARRLRAGVYERAYLPHRSLRSAALALWAGIPDRIGFAGAPAGWTYTRRVPRPPGGHESRRLLALAGPLEDTDCSVSLGLTAEDHARAERWLIEAGVQAGGGFVALAPGSIWGTKRWPYYAALAEALDGPVVVVGGADDAPLAEAIVARVPGRAVSAVGRLSLRESAALLARADALVTNDSAPLHFASAVGTPVVALFGPTVPAFGFGPLGPGEVVEHPDLACRPCSRHGPQTCPLGHHRCLREVTPDVVLAALGRIRAGRRTRWP